MKQIINQRLRIGLGMEKPKKDKPFKVVPHRSAFRPGVDFLRLNQLADELEAEAIAEKISRQQ